MTSLTQRCRVSRNEKLVGPTWEGVELVPQGTLLSLVARTFCLLNLFLLIGNAQLSSGSTPNKIDGSLSNRSGRVFARLDGRERISLERRQHLETKLRQITGLLDLNFQEDGVLQLNHANSSSGSKSARALLERAVQGKNVIVIEDTSRRPDVIFARVVATRGASQTSQIYLVQIDFVDFEFLMGDGPALKAFDVGWALLHELDHVVEDSEDSGLRDEVGECETHINRMREECNLPLRAGYFHTLLPRSNETEFASKFVRLPFVQKTTNKQKRYWVMWDAGVVGGLEDHRPSLSLTYAAESRAIR